MSGEGSERTLFAAVDRADAALEAIHSALPSTITELDDLRATVARLRRLCDEAVVQSPVFGIVAIERLRAALDGTHTMTPAPGRDDTTGAGDEGVAALLAAAEGTNGWGEHVQLTRDDVAEWLRGRAEEWPTHPWMPAATPRRDEDADGDGGTCRQLWLHEVRAQRAALERLKALCDQAVEEASRDSLAYLTVAAVQAAMEDL